MKYPILVIVFIIISCIIIVVTAFSLPYSSSFLTVPAAAVTNDDGSVVVYDKYRFNDVKKWLVQFDMTISDTWLAPSKYYGATHEYVFRYPNKSSTSNISVVVFSGYDSLSICFAAGQCKQYAVAPLSSNSFQLTFAAIGDKFYYRCRNNENFSVTSTTPYPTPVIGEYIRYYKDVENTQIGHVTIDNVRINAFPL